MHRLRGVPASRTLVLPHRADSAVQPALLYSGPSSAAVGCRALQCSTIHPQGQDSEALVAAEAEQDLSAASAWARLKRHMLHLHALHRQTGNASSGAETRCV